MRTIALIGCSAKKQGKNEPQKMFVAGEIYTGFSFKKARDLGIEHFGCEKDYYILSAEYGLLDCHKKIAYYDKYLGEFSIKEKKDWAERVYKQLTKKFDLHDTQFVIFAGSDYTQYLKNRLNCVLLKYKGRQITFEVKEKHVLED